MPQIREVWEHNLEEEMCRISHILTTYTHIAMDTEFPGVVARPVGGFRNNSEYQYQTLRCNVDLLKIIQLGLAFADENGNLPKDCPCWQFNFKFNLSEDMYAQDSIDLLTQSGIDFEEFERNGIDVLHFGELLISSGLVLNENVTWISFHSSYDFGYLLKVLTCSNLPQSEAEFFELMKLYFPRFWDMKFLMTDRFFGGLSKLAEYYDVQRHGQMHQAGSDSLLTLEVFFKMRQSTFHGHVQADCMNILYGLGAGHNSGRDVNNMYLRNGEDGKGAESNGNGNGANNAGNNTSIINSGKQGGDTSGRRTALLNDGTVVYGGGNPNGNNVVAGGAGSKNGGSSAFTNGGNDSIKSGSNNV
eukprot:CAMPEP_0184700290 /NCGR_PEP_ID=MMETSP0313-20130426/11589_1 /TAXON_ID=2792 /ORGANISM="Porphyridium aerugineum, Strain SAG 1380-2" /LENGTH=358 /DNA_ID=CAMNT_0027159879 /DNA_START=366 /DNA_END=1439 /DNA_ORIENTATION=+